MRPVILAAIATLVACPAFADALPKFGTTCVGKSGWNTNVCVASNGNSLSSTYKWKGQVATTGTHTGCRMASAKLIMCSSGKYRTASASGKMDPFKVTLSKAGKPSSVVWVQ